MTRGTRICPDKQADLIARYAAQRSRTSMTARRVQQLLAKLIGAGVLARGPGGYRGRAQTYIAVIPVLPPDGVYQVRPRGLAPRRLHASFTRETGRIQPRHPPLTPAHNNGMTNGRGG